MKYKQDVRRIGALERTLHNIEEYKQLLAKLAKKPSPVIQEMIDTKFEGDVEKAREHVGDKLKKAEKCVTNLEAKGIKAS